MLYFCLSEKVFLLYFWVQKTRLVSFFLSTLNISLPSPPICMVSEEKLDIILTSDPV